MPRRGRAGRGKVIVEGFVPFEYEITLLTVRAVDGIHFCDPIGHRQEDGDYRESWQPQAMGELALARAKEVAAKVVEALGGHGLFGVELFVRGDEVWFSEVSPPPRHRHGDPDLPGSLRVRPARTRRILGLPIGTITTFGPSASAVVLREATARTFAIKGIGEALAWCQVPSCACSASRDRRSSPTRGGAGPWPGLH